MKVSPGACQILALASNLPTQLAGLAGSEMNFSCRLTDTDTNHPQHVISPKQFKLIKLTRHFSGMVLALVRNYLKTGLFKMLFSICTVCFSMIKSTSVWLNELIYVFACSRDPQMGRVRRTGTVSLKSYFFLSSDAPKKTLFPRVLAFFFFDNLFYDVPKTEPKLIQKTETICVLQKYICSFQWYIA